MGRILVLTLMWLAVVPECSAIIAYDCTRPETNITAVSLSSVSPCSAPRKITRFDKVEIQLLQERNSDVVPVRACLVERSYEIFHCGMHSHSSAAAGGFVAGEVIDMSREACIGAHETGRLTLGGGFIISGLKVNTSGIHPVTEMGVINAGTHACQGAAFSLRGITYTNAVMRSSYKVTLVGLSLNLDLQTGKLRTPSGYSHEYKAGAGFDADLGHVFWEAGSHMTKCEPTSYAVLYEGEAYIVGEVSGERTLLVNASEKAMAVTLGERTLMCYSPAFRTEHPKLYVMTREPGATSFRFRSSPLEPTDVDMFLYMNSKLMYVERHLGSEMRSLYSHFHERMCELKQHSLRQLASLGYIAPEEFAWLYTGRAGVTAVTKGEVVYVINCPPVVVQFRETHACHLELPVYDASNRSAFVKPRSRILTPYGTETDCSPLAPTMFHMGNGWITFTPFPTAAAAPRTMTAEPESLWEYKAIPNLVSSGIYSREILMRYQERLMFPVAREAVVHTMAASAAGFNVDSSKLDVSRLFSETGLEGIHTTFMKKMYGWWWNFSTNVAGVMGVMFIVAAIRTVTGMVLNYKMLHQTFGWSLKLVGFLCGSLTKYLLFQHQEHPVRARERTAKIDAIAGTDDRPGVHHDESDERIYTPESTPSAPPSGFYPDARRLRQEMEVQTLLGKEHQVV
ncbi:glycoprotein [Karukera tick virus]|uniref:Glycoprotein n=1 Tax=Karukera tick virus TaxID=2678334 RepID=A0A6B9CP05_9VIRU|nr:glycoprotein [Karukera tick virus]QGW51123.1 glycoprotein [Karukera tick virus]